MSAERGRRAARRPWPRAAWAGAAVAAAAVKAGAADVRLEIRGAGEAAVVRLPPEAGTRAWPVIFFYHGMGGHPTVEPLARLAAASNFVLVGMPYAHRDGSGGESRWRDEWDLLNRARADVARHVRLRLDAMWIGGVSMGGWTAATLGDRESATWAGLVILLAGRPWQEFRLSADAWRGKTVYIGAGDTDPNLPAARRAATFYRMAGATVTFEVFPGVGHAVPPSIPGLEAWLDCRGRLDAMGAVGRAQARAWFDQRMAEATGEADVWARYGLCRAARDDPRMALAGPEAAARLNQAAAVLTSEGRVAADMAAETDLERWYAAAWRARQLDDMKAVRAGMERLAAQYPDTAAAGHARRECEVLAGIISASESAASAAARASGQPPPAPAPPARAPTRTRAVPPLRRR